MAKVNILAYESGSDANEYYYNEIQKLIDDGNFTYFISWADTAVASSSPEIVKLSSRNTYPCRFIDLLREKHKAEEEPFEKYKTFSLTVVSQGHVDTDNDASYFSNYVTDVKLIYIDTIPNSEPRYRDFTNSFIDLKNVSVWVNGDRREYFDEIDDYTTKKIYQQIEAVMNENIKRTEKEAKQCKDNAKKYLKRANRDVGNAKKLKAAKKLKERLLKTVLCNLCNDILCYSLPGDMQDDYRHVEKRVKSQTLEQMVNYMNEDYVDKETCHVTMDVNMRASVFIVKPSEKEMLIPQRYYCHPFSVLSDERVIANVMKCIKKRNEIKRPRIDEGQNFHLFAKEDGLIKNNCKDVIFNFFFKLGTKPNEYKWWNFVFVMILYRWMGKENIDEYQDQCLKKHFLDYIIWIRIPLKDVPLEQRTSIESSVKSLVFSSVDAMPLEKLKSVYKLINEQVGIYILKFLKSIGFWDQCHRVDEVIEMAHLTHLWNYLVRNRELLLKSKKFVKIIMAQYQNYAVIDDEIVLLSGECQERYRCEILNNVSPGKMLYFLQQLKLNSTCSNNEETINIICNAKEVKPEIIYIENENSVNIDHVEICASTCRPYSVCPKTKLPWKECLRGLKTDGQTGDEQMEVNRWTKSHEQIGQDAEESERDEEEEEQTGPRGRDADENGQEDKGQTGEYLKVINNIGRNGELVSYFELYGKFCELYKKFPTKRELIKFVERNCVILNVYHEKYFDNTITKVMNAFEAIRKDTNIESFIRQRHLSENIYCRRKMEGSYYNNLKNDMLEY